MNVKDTDSIQNNITDMSTIRNSNESKEHVLNQEQNVTNSKFF